MKRNTNFLSLFLLGGTLCLWSCDGSKGPTSTNSDSTSATKLQVSADTSGRNTGSSTSSNAAADPNQDAINYAVPKNATEIAWLKAGIANATNKELKAHCKMMLTDHEGLATKVKDLIAKKNYAVPTFDTTNAVNLTEKPGTAWDKAFTSKMISEHKDILEKFGQSQKTVTDADLNALITKTIPVVQSHLDMVEKLDKSLK